jgi:hypothetical protein
LREKIRKFLRSCLETHFGLSRSSIKRIIASCTKASLVSGSLS